MSRNDRDSSRAESHLRKTSPRAAQCDDACERESEPSSPSRDLASYRLMQLLALIETKPHGNRKSSSSSAITIIPDVKSSNW
jgi:hypothetical protein